MTDMKKHRFKMETVVCEYCSEKTTCLYDIGVGPKSEYLSIQQMMPHLEFFGCEPDPRSFEKISKKFPGKMCQVAIGETFGTTNLHLRKDSKQSSVFHIPGANQTTEVIQWTLDFFDTNFGNPDGILLWMDIEGSELNALKGGTDLLNSGRVEVINLEVRDKVNIDGWCTADEVDEYLKKFGYEMVRKYNNQISHWDVIYKKAD